MTERIELAPEDIVFNDDGFAVYDVGGYNIQHQFKEQILDDYKKSEKWDKLKLRESSELSGIVMDLNDKLEQENKQLQERLKIAQDQRIKQGEIWLEKLTQLKEIAKESLPFLDRIGGAIHLSDKFRKLLQEK